MKIGIDNEIIELTGKELEEFEAMRLELKKQFDANKNG